MIQKRTSAADDFFQNWDVYRDGIRTPDAANYWIGTDIYMTECEIIILRLR